MKLIAPILFASALALSIAGCAPPGVAGPEAREEPAIRDDTKLDAHLSKKDQNSTSLADSVGYSNSKNVRTRSARSAQKWRHYQLCAIKTKGGDYRGAVEELQNVISLRETFSSPELVEMVVFKDLYLLHLLLQEDQLAVTNLKKFLLFLNAGKLSSSWGHRALELADAERLSVRTHEDTLRQDILSLSDRIEPEPLPLDSSFVRSTFDGDPLLKIWLSASLYKLTYTDSEKMRARQFIGLALERRPTDQAVKLLCCLAAYQLGDFGQCQELYESIALIEAPTAEWHNAKLRLRAFLKGRNVIE